MRLGCSAFPYPPRPHQTALAGIAALVLCAAAPSSAPADCTPLPLPAVTVGDLDADGRYTGGDIGVALERCEALGGCVLDLLPQTYDDVALLVHAGDGFGCTASRTTCSVHALPNGLVIRGRGAATVLRSPLWEPPYQPEPIVEIRRRPELRFQLRDLVLDGRKTEQRAPTPGVNDSDGWQHFGFVSWNRYVDSYPKSLGGCVENVAVRDLMTAGIALGDASGWTIRHNTVEDVGCHEGFTPCPQVAIPDARSGLPGWKAPGFGIFIRGDVDDLVLEDNTVRRTTKYAIAFKAADGTVASIRRPRVTDNQVLDAGHIGFFLAGLDGGWFQDNRVDTIRLHGQTEERAGFFDTFGVSCMGRVERTTFFGDEILDAAGIGFNYQCDGEGNRIAHTRIARSCRIKHPGFCSPSGGCYAYHDLRVAAAEGSLTVQNVEIHDTDCAAPFGVSGGSHQLTLTLLGLEARQNACDRIDLSGDASIGIRDRAAFYGALATCHRAGRWVGACDQVDLSGDGKAGLPDMAEFEKTFAACVGP